MFHRRKPAPAKITIEGTIVWQFAQDAGTQDWVGVCQALNLNALGETYADAQSMAAEAMGELFAALLAAGELEAFLHRNGWHVASALPAPGADARFDVPFDSRRISAEAMLAATG